MGRALPDPLPSAAGPGYPPRCPGTTRGRGGGWPAPLRSDVPDPDRRAGCPGLRCAPRCAVTNVDNVFRYGGSGESNGHSIASQEQSQQPAKAGDGTPPKPPPVRTEPASDPRGGGGVTGRLVLVALILILLGTGAGLAGAR